MLWIGAGDCPIMSSIAAMIVFAFGWYVQRFNAAALLQHAHAIHIFVGSGRLHIDDVAAIVVFDFADHIAHRAPVAAIAIIVALLVPARRLGQCDGAHCRPGQCAGNRQRESEMT